MVLIRRGGTKNYIFSTHDTHSELCDAIRISKGYRKEKWGYFLRAESFYNVATQEEEYTDSKHPSVKDAFDYIEFYILSLAILCVAIAAPTFAGEYQTGGDSILRTTQYGRKQLAITKILAAFTLFVVTFLVGITVHILGDSFLLQTSGSIKEVQNRMNWLSATRRQKKNQTI